MCGGHTNFLLFLLRSSSSFPGPSLPFPPNDNGGRRSGRKSRSAWKMWPVSRERKKGDLWPLLEFYLALKRGVVAQWGALMYDVTWEQ